jgi:LPXTG-motif cell wall-anchored protein
MSKITRFVSVATFATVLLLEPGGHQHQVAAEVAVSSRPNATINVVKAVVNDNGGSKVIADFPLFVNGTLVVSGITNTFPAPAVMYRVTETSDSSYTQTFSGDCDASGYLNLNPGENKFCIITNNDIGAPVVVAPVPPLIDVVKVSSPLALPFGPGPVIYTYTLYNIGTVPVTNITMVGDTCTPIMLASGDTNADGKLDVNETWVHRCATTLTETHTNTVVATGWANGVSAVDIASATVIVGLPVVPPLIHVTKVPSLLALSAGGGMVTYTKKVTNPGLVALSNVRLVDDKCGPVKYVSGDTNVDAKLDIAETWTYTCTTKLTQTTTNTVIAQGEANGLTARDIALATVVVANAVPTLPNTGISPDISILWGVMIPTGIFAALGGFYIGRKKRLI